MTIGTMGINFMKLCDMPTPCPICGLPPDIKDLSQPFAPAKFNAFHGCDMGDFYIESKRDYKTEQDAVAGWNDMIKDLSKN